MIVFPCKNLLHFNHVIVSSEALSVSRLTSPSKAVGRNFDRYYETAKNSYGYLYNCCVVDNLVILLYRTSGLQRRIRTCV